MQLMASSWLRSDNGNQQPWEGTDLRWPPFRSFPIIYMWMQNTQTNQQTFSQLTLFWWSVLGDILWSALIRQRWCLLICDYISRRHWSAGMDKALLLQWMQKGNTYPATWDEFDMVFSKALHVVMGESDRPLWAISWRARLERELLPN